MSERVMSSQDDTSISALLAAAGDRWFCSGAGAATDELGVRLFFSKIADVRQLVGLPLIRLDQEEDPNHQ
jgi:hypothetical protein